jgi:hypothetical protein
MSLLSVMAFLPKGLFVDNIAKHMEIGKKKIISTVKKLFLNPVPLYGYRKFIYCRNLTYIMLSVVDPNPNPKYSECFGWIRIRIRKKNSDSDTDSDSDSDTVVG